MGETCSNRITCEIRELKDIVKQQNKRIEELIRQFTEGCKNDEAPIESTMKNMNPYLECLNPDILYHLGLDTATTDFEKVFGDVRFVCLGGTKHRMHAFANRIMSEIGLKMNSGVQLKDISESAHRYAMFKAGPVLCCSHGIGCPSIGILLHELIKMMHYAKCQNPIFFRIGTCGGLGVEPGTVCITTQAVDGLMRPSYEVIVHAKSELRPADVDADLVKELQALKDPCKDNFSIVTGKTLCANDFYEGQSRMDGAFCEYTPEAKTAFLQKLSSDGIINIEMESTAFAALTNHAGIRAAVICVAIVNRLEGDQITACRETLSEWDSRPQTLVARYMRKAIYGEDEDEPKCICDNTQPIE